MRLLILQLTANMKSFSFFSWQVACNPIFLALVSNPRPILWVSAPQSISISRPHSHASPQKTSPDSFTARRNWKPWSLTVFLTELDHYGLHPGSKSGWGWSSWSHLWPYFLFRCCRDVSWGWGVTSLNYHYSVGLCQCTQYKDQIGEIKDKAQLKIWMWMMKFWRKTVTKLFKHGHQTQNSDFWVWG